MEILFSSALCREVKRLSKRAPDLPEEILRAIAASITGALPGVILIAANEAAKSQLLKCRIGSPYGKEGKRGGYRLYFARVKDNIMLLAIVSKREADDLPQKALRAFAERCADESLASLDEKWLTLEEFRAQFKI